ncbi:40526_t:CDS:1, partial [Gigaspora margarita]
MTLYQSSTGSVWITGTYQYGFFDPYSTSWHYDWTIRNGCKEMLFNLTEYLHTEYACCSGCNGYEDTTCPPSSKRKRSSLRKRNSESTCPMGPDGSKPWVIKIDDLKWDCDNEGFKYKTCDKDLYKKELGGDDDKEKPKRKKDEGPSCGLYLVIEGSDKSGKRADMSAPAAINVNDQ